MKDLRVGKRTLKTALAVVLSLYIGSLLQLKSPLFAGFAAVVVMQGSVYDSFRVLKDRMLATITGAVVGLIIIATGYQNYFTMALGIILVILICTNFAWKNSIALGCITFLIILVNEGGHNEFQYAVHRALDTLIGLVVGTAVNYLIFPPHPLRLIIKTYRSIERDLYVVFKDFLQYEKPMQISLIQSDLLKAEADYVALKKQRRLRLVNQDLLTLLEEVNALLFQIASHMIVVGAENERHNLTTQALKDVRQVLPDLVIDQPEEPHELYDSLYSYHIERIAELLLLIQDKMQLVYELGPEEKKDEEKPQF